MDERLESNKSLWNALTDLHVESAFYDMEGFKAGRIPLNPLEREEMGDVKGKSLLHLMCHFGLDTLSWARLGAKVTGVDFSDRAIDYARKLGGETSIRADFICSDIYRLPEIHQQKYDIVFTSYGVLSWLPDLDKWAEIVAYFLKPGGFFYIAEIHPILAMFFHDDPLGDSGGLQIRSSYFPGPEPDRFEGGTDYASSFQHDLASYEWKYPLGNVIGSLIAAGLKIEYLHEFPFCCFRALPEMRRDKDGWWRLEGDKIPLTFSIKAMNL